MHRDAILAVEQRNLGAMVGKSRRDACAGGDERAQRGIRPQAAGSGAAVVIRDTMRSLKSWTLSTSSVMGTWLTRLAAGAVRVSLLNKILTALNPTFLRFVTVCVEQMDAPVRG